MVEGQLMGYKAVINSSLNNAFKQLKDLAVEAQLITGEDSFDFNTQTVKSVKENQIIKLVKLSESKRSQDQKTFTCELLINIREIGDIKRSDSVIFEGHTWKIGEIISNTGFVVMCSANREAV
jgi:hypothetical protein